MTAKKKLLIAIVGGAIFLAVVVASLWNLMFSGATHSSVDGGKLNPADLAEGQMVYQAYTLFSQEPVSLNGVAQLQSDNSYFYDAAQGDIETIYVKDGQYVKKGDILFAYFQDKNKYDLEDALREQTRLYNQREDLIAQLREQTGGIYNYQGDQISTYWSEDGKQQYYVVEAIGKSNTTANTSSEDGAPAGGDLKEQIRQVNRQIEDHEIKLIRLKEQQHGQVKAKFAGKVVLDEEGRDNSQIPLVRIISNEVAVEGSVSEYEFYVLGTGRPARLFINAEERELKGEMVEYDAIPAPTTSSQGSAAPATPSSGDTSGARYRFKIAPEEFIQPGFSVKVQIDLPGIVIPKEAILEENGKTYVFIVRDRIAHKTEIKLERQGIQQVALKDVAVDDVLLLNPFDVKDGQEVTTDLEINTIPEGEETPPQMDVKG